MVEYAPRVADGRMVGQQLWLGRGLPGSGMGTGIGAGKVRAACNCRPLYKHLSSHDDDQVRYAP